MSDKDQAGCWISLLLRLSIGSLFLAAGVAKFMGGLEGVVTAFQGTFQETWLPMFLVVLLAKVIAYLEVVLAIWLFFGWKLRVAWIVTGLTLVGLAFGMVVAKQHAIAGQNYVYVLIACAGLYFSQYDKLSVDGLAQ